MNILEVKGLRKVYTSRLGSTQVEALRQVNFSMAQGEYVAIMGESGSGKTTLLNILAALDRAHCRSGAPGRTRSGRDSGKAMSLPSGAIILALFFRILTCWTLSPLEDNIYLPLVLAGRSYPVNAGPAAAPSPTQLGIARASEKISRTRSPAGRSSARPLPVL